LRQHHSKSATEGTVEQVVWLLSTRHKISMGVQAGTEAAAEGPTVDSWCVSSSMHPPDDIK
jgi:hypothetical protein